MEKVVEQINGVKPELVLIGGDYFDGSLSEYNSLTDPLKKIESKFGVFFVFPKRSITQASSGKSLSQVL